MGEENYTKVCEDIYLFVVSYINDKEGTLKFMRDNDIQLKFSDYDLVELVEKQGIYYYGNLQENPSSVILDINELIPFCYDIVKTADITFLGAILRNLDKQTAADVAKQINVNNFSNLDVIWHQDILKHIYAEEEIKMIRAEYGGEEQNYNSEREKSLLKMLGTEHVTIENYLASIKNVNVNDLTLFQKCALAMYGKKILHMNNIEKYEVNLFEDKKNDQTNGDYTYKNGGNVINIYDCSNEENYTVLKCVRTISHECEHAIQNKNMKNSDLDADSNTLTYSEDNFLSICLGYQYYSDNYDQMSYEFDAFYKAYMRSKNLSSTIGELYEETKNNVKKEMQSQKYLNSKFSKIAERSEYEEFNNVMRKHEGNSYPIFVLVEKVLDKELNGDKKEETIKLIKNNYPLLAVEYDLENNGKRRTLVELFDLMDNCQNEKTKKIIHDVILQRFNIERKKYDKDSVSPDYIAEHYHLKELPARHAKYIRGIMEDIIEFLGFEEEDARALREKAIKIEEKCKGLRQTI